MKQIYLTIFNNFIRVKKKFFFFFHLNRNDAVLRFYCHTQSEKGTLSQCEISKKHV